MSFHKRYLSGEHVKVWKELCALGEGICDEPTYSDALRVCKEVVRRALRNLRTLHGRLKSLGYKFAHPDAALVVADKDSIAHVEAVERKYGRLPLIASVWYRSISSVDFDQADSQLTYDVDKPPPPVSDVFGLGDHSQLVVQSVKCAVEHWGRMREKNLRWIRQGIPRELFETKPFFPLGSYQSNCCPHAFNYKVYAIDAPVWESWRSEDRLCFFVEGLRDFFKWGGFPRWKSLARGRRERYDHGNFQPNFRKLLPILRQGLVEL